MKGCVVKQYHVALSDFLRDKPIEGIKRLRGIFNLGLREAKDQIDAMRPTGKSMLMTEEQKELMLQAGFTIFGNTTRTVQVFIRDDGQKINAIKKLRQATGWGLKETKDVMDEMWGFGRPVDIGIINEYQVTVLRNYGFTVTGWVSEMFKDNEDLFTI